MFKKILLILSALIFAISCSNPSNPNGNNNTGDGGNNGNNTGNVIQAMVVIPKQVLQIRRKSQLFYKIKKEFTEKKKMKKVIRK